MCVPPSSCRRLRLHRPPGQLDGGGALAVAHDEGKRHLVEDVVVAEESKALQAVVRHVEPDVEAEVGSVLRDHAIPAERHGVHRGPVHGIDGRYEVVPESEEGRAGEQAHEQGVAELPPILPLKVQRPLAPLHVVDRPRDVAREAQKHGVGHRRLDRGRSRGAEGGHLDAERQGSADAHRDAGIVREACRHVVERRKLAALPVEQEWGVLAEGVLDELNARGRAHDDAWFGGRLSQGCRGLQQQYAGQRPRVPAYPAEAPACHFVCVPCCPGAAVPRAHPRRADSSRLVRRAKAPFLSGCESRPATVAPAGSSRSGRWR